MNKQQEVLAEGSLISHLVELRSRLVRAMLAVCVTFIPCAFFANPIFEFVSTPLIQKLPKGGQLIATSVTSGFMAPFKLSIFVAVFIAMPYILYQAWAFVAPGLYRNEKRFALPLLVSSIIFFYLGVFFAYKLVFPTMFAFFVATTPAGVTMMTDISSYLDFVLIMFLAFGVAFEMPIAVVLLVQTNLISIEKLTSNRGYVLIGIFVVSAFLTPPDAVSQSMMAIPMYLLYESGIVMARIVGRTKPPSTANTA